MSFYALVIINCPEKSRGKIVSPVCWFENWPPYTEDKERPKKEVDDSRLVGGSFNK